MTWSLTQRDRDRMKGLHPDLVRVIERAAKMSMTRFVVLEGMRTLARQQQLLAQRATKTLNSRHLTGHAIDIAPMIGGKVSWDWPAYYPLAQTVKAAAAAEGVQIEWGGDWRSFKDGPHWQLPWARYPK